MQNDKQEKLSQMLSQVREISFREKPGALIMIVIEPLPEAFKWDSYSFANLTGKEVQLLIDSGLFKTVNESLQEQFLAEMGVGVTAH